MEIFDLKDKQEYIKEVIELEHNEWASNPKENFQKRVDEKNKIVIEKIDLNQDIYSYNESSVDENIIYLKETNVKKDFFILAAHSGNSNISYFRNLNKLKINDELKIIFNNRSLKFKVDNIYYVRKTGKIILPVDSKDVLYLTTCDKYNKNKQLIVKCVKKM